MIPLNELIYSLVEQIVSKEVVPLIDLLEGKQDVSEFKLADKLEITVNKVRNMLYKLHSYSLVDFMRKKDKRKGWYIYYWTFDLKKALMLLISFNQEKIDKLNEKLSQKQLEDYFVCPDNCTVLVYSDAMDQDFRCSECGNLLQKMDTKKQICQIKKRIEVLKKELEDGKVYLKIEDERLEKKKERAEKRAKKKAEKNKVVKKKVVKKKVVKKKVVKKKVVKKKVVKKKVKKVVKKKVVKKKIVKKKVVKKKVVKKKIVKNKVVKKKGKKKVVLSIIKPLK